MRDKSRNRIDRLICKNNKRSDKPRKREIKREKNSVTYISFFPMKNVLRARARKREKESASKMSSEMISFQ